MTLPLDDPWNRLKLMACLVVAVCIPLWMFFLFLRNVWTYWSAQGWAVAHGVILESVVFVHEARKAEHFRIRYEFTVLERIEGNTPRASGDFFYSDEAQRDFVNRYRSGQAVAVYYDPRNPKKNCIDRTDKSGVVAKGLMFLMTVVMSGGLGFGIWKLLNWK
jgi:hypothetical protein